MATISIQYIFYCCTVFLAIRAVEIKFAALVDNEANETRQILRYAVELANRPSEIKNIFTLDVLIADIEYGSEFLASRKLCKMFKSGIAAVFGPTSPSVSTHCMNICDAKEIPYIDVHWNAETQLPVINMQPHPDALQDIFVTLIREWNWKEFTILYESAPWLPRVSKLVKLYDKKGYTVTIRKLNTGLTNDNYRPILRRVKLSKDLHILLVCSVEALPEILKQASQVGLMTEFHEYIITNLDMHSIDLEPFQYSGTNITGIRLVNPENPLIMELSKNIAETQDSNEEAVYEGITVEKMRYQTALLFDGVLLLAEAFKQLDIEQLRTRKMNCNNFETSENGFSITNFMRSSVINGLTGEVKFDNKGQRTDFSVDIVELTWSGLEKVGSWKPNELNMTRFTETTSVIIDDNSLSNRTFIVLTTLTEPYGMFKDSALEMKGNERFEGFGIDIIHELSLMLGFNYTLRLQEDGVYGSYVNITNSWNGMIGELLSGRADLAITDLTITLEREQIVDFTSPFMNLGISILAKAPTKEPPSTFAFLSPFSTEVWIYLGAAYLGVSVFLFVLGRIAHSEWDNPYPCIEEPTVLVNQFSLSNSLWFTIGALLQQGSEIAPKAPSTRVLSTVWWFFTLIMVSSYTANLAAFLTVESNSPKITSAEDLKDCGTPPYDCPVQFGAKKGGSTFNFFKVSAHSTYKNMYEYMDYHPHFLTENNKQGVEMALDSNYAFLMESSTIEHIIERNCNLMQVGEPLDEKGYGIAMRKNSSYRSILSEGVLRLQEQGRLSALKTRWWKEKKGGGQCSAKTEGDKAEPLSMPNMYGVFIVLLVGSVFASLFGMLEWFVGILLRSLKFKTELKEELVNELKVLIKSNNTKAVHHREIEHKRQSVTPDRSNNSMSNEFKDMLELDK